MTEFKLSYTANEINRKLGKVDSLVSTVNGVTPDENGNVNIDVGSTGGIIDVIELPTENINESAFYRLLTAKFVSSYTIDGWTCYCVNGLPTVGESVSTDMVNITGYYNLPDNEVYGYADENISAVGGIPVGWYPIGVLGQAFNVTWGGVITDVDDIDDSVKVLLSYDFYIYKNGWSLVPFAYEKQPKFDITWDGDMTGRSALDMSMLGYNQGVYFVKVSDIIPTVDEVVGGSYKGVWHNEDGFNDNDFIYDNDLNTTTYPGAFIIGDFITVLYDADTLSNALGIPTGIYTNGVYFWIYTDVADGGHITRFTAPTKIIKIDEKFLPDMSVDISSLGLHSVATTGNYNSLNNRPTIYTDVIRYGVSNQGLSSTYKSNVRNNIDVYSRSEVDTKIAEAIGTAIGGSY